MEQVSRIALTEEAAPLDTSPHHERELIYSIQQIRAVAAFIVVLTHVWGSLHSIPGTVTIDLREVNIGFTFAAGFLFQALSINKPFLAFYKGRIKNVVVPYLIVSLPAVAMYVIGHKNHPHIDLSQMSGWQLAPFLYATGLHLGPLWFIPMIMLVYAATPLWKLVDRHNAYWYVVPLGLLASVFVFLRPAFNAMPPIAALHYAPIFLLGMFCSRFRVSIERVAASVWPAALVLLIALWALSAWLDNYTQWPVKIVMLACLHLLTIRTQVFHSAVIDVMAKNSFGIFFLHGYFASILRILQGKGVTIDATLPNALLISAIVTAVCVAIITVIRRVLPGKSRYLVGV